MNIKCALCSKEINRIINDEKIIINQNSKHYYHYGCYQNFLIDKLNNVINQMKTKSNIDLIKIFLIDEELKLNPFEKNIFMDYYLNTKNKSNCQPITNQNNMIVINSLKKSPPNKQTDKNHIIETFEEEHIDEFILKLKNSLTSKLDENLLIKKILTDNSLKSDDFVSSISKSELISSTSLSLESTTDSFETAICDNSIETDIETDSDSFFNSDSELD
jgi:hypothetical protein